jgi:hypothetical protein
MHYGWVGVMAWSFHRLHNDLNESYGRQLQQLIAREVVAVACIVRLSMSVLAGYARIQDDSQSLDE